MSCGIEHLSHLSNCHGEITGLTLLLGGGIGYWLRNSYRSCCSHCSLLKKKVSDFFVKDENKNETKKNS